MVDVLLGGVEARMSMQRAIVLKASIWSAQRSGGRPLGWGGGQNVDGSSAGLHTADVSEST